MKLKRMLGKCAYPYLPYNYRHKLVFIHVPKCGGTSVLSALNRGARVPRYHADWRAYRQADPAAFNNFFKFAIVREPADRLLSAYHYLRAGGNRVDDQWISALINERFDSFDQFVLEHLDPHTVHEHLLFKPQYLFLYDGTVACQVDQVIKYENFADEVPQLLQRIGLGRDQLGHTNRSTRVDAESGPLSPRVLEHINRLYQRDYDLLDYGAP